MSKITWNDLHEGTSKELKSKYQLTDIQFEQQVRSHLKGSSTKDREKFYNMVWSKDRNKG